jgi:hypothetical protein
MANKIFRIVPELLPDANNELADVKDYEIQIRNGSTGTIYGLTSESPQTFAPSDGTCTGCIWVTLVQGDDYDYYEITVDDVSFPNLQSRYKARDHANNTSSWSEWGNIITVFCDFSGVTGLSVASSSSTITVSWTLDRTDWIENFEIIRTNLTAGGTSTFIVSNPAAASYIDATISAGNQYSYDVRVTCFTGEQQTFSAGSAGLCDFSNIGNFQALYNDSTGNVDLTWSNNSANNSWIDSIVIHKNNITDGVTGDITITNNSATSYTDTIIQLGKTYQYTLEYVCDTYSQTYAYPEITLCNFALFDTINLTQALTGITIEWINPSPEIWDWIDKIEIYRNGVLATTINTVTSNTYLDVASNLEFGKIYSYRLKVFCIDGRVKNGYSTTLRFINKCNATDLTTIEAYQAETGITIVYGPLNMGNEWIDSIDVQVKPTSDEIPAPSVTPTENWTVGGWNTYVALSSAPIDNTYTVLKAVLDPNFNYQFRLIYHCIDGATVTQLDSNIVRNYSGDFRIVKLSDGKISKKVGIPYLQQQINELKSKVSRCIRLAELCDVDVELSYAILGSNSPGSTNPFATINDVLNNVPTLNVSDLDDISDDEATILTSSLARANSEGSEFVTISEMTDHLLEINIALENLSDVTVQQSQAFRAMENPSQTNPVMTLTAVNGKLALLRLSNLRYMTENIEAALINATNAAGTNPFVTTIELNNTIAALEMKDLSNITSDQEAAVLSATNPTGANPFATVTHAKTLVDNAVSHLAAKVGETIISGATTYGSTYQISSGDTHNEAIAKLDTVIYSTGNAVLSLNTKIDNIGIIIGESVVISSVTWASPTYISANDDHHEAIAHLDNALSTRNLRISKLATNTGANADGNNVNYTITNAAIVNGDSHHTALGKLQGQLNAVENLTYFKTKVGENVTSAVTDFASNHYITDGDSHNVALGKLDLAISSNKTSLNNIFNSKLDLPDNNAVPNWTVNDTVITASDKIFPALNKINTHVADMHAIEYPFAINVWGGAYTMSVDLWATIVSAAGLTYADGVAVGAGNGQNEVKYNLGITTTDQGKLKIKRKGTTGSKIEIKLTDGAETTNGDDKTTSSTRDAVRIVNASFNTVNGAHGTINTNYYRLSHDSISVTPAHWTVTIDGTPFTPNNVVSTHPIATGDIYLKQSTTDYTVFKLSDANDATSTLVLTYRYATSKYWTIQGVAKAAKHFNDTIHNLNIL